MRSINLAVALLLLAVATAHAARSLRQTTTDGRLPSAEPLDSDNDDATVRPGQFNKANKAVLKKFVKINRLNKEAASHTSRAIEKLSSSSTQYHTQSFVSSSSNSRPSTGLSPVEPAPTASAMPLFVASRLIAEAESEAPAFVRSTTRSPAQAYSTAAHPSTVQAKLASKASTGATSPTTTTTVAPVTRRTETPRPTATQSRRVLRTGSSSLTTTNKRVVSAGANNNRLLDNQPQASLTKKSYTANQFVEEEEDTDDYYSRRRARFLFRSRVGK